MKRLYTVFVLIAILAIGGIGYNVLQASDEDKKPEPQGDKNQVVKELLDGKLTYIMSKDDEGVVTVQLKNISGEPVTLNYSSSQAYDYRLLKDGEVAYHWAASAGFLTIMTDKTLQSGESDTYVVDTKELPVDAGTYDIEFYSVAMELANEPKVSMTVEMKVTRQSPLPTEPNMGLYEQDLQDGKMKYSMSVSDLGIMDIDLTNQSSEPITLNFSSSQFYELQLMQDGEVAYTWSADKMFTAAEEEVTIEPGESDKYSFLLRELPVDNGEYELVFHSMSRELLDEAKLVAPVTK